MTAITAPATTTAAHPVRRATVVSGAVAAAVTTAIAATADAAGVPLAIDGEAIPLLGFAQLTAVGAALGGLLAAALNRWGTDRRRSTFVVATVVLTILSCIPSIALPPDAATKIVLVTTHVVAAAIIVPTLVRRLHASR